MNGHLTILQYLIGKHIDVLTRNFEDYTCFEHAENMGNLEVAEYLEPVIMKADMWRNKNCLVKIFLNKKRIPTYNRVPKGVFREIIKYA